MFYSTLIDSHLKTLDLNKVHAHVILSIEKKLNDRPLSSDDVKEAPYFSFYIGT